MLWAMLVSHAGEWARTSPGQTLLSVADALDRAVLGLGWICGSDGDWHRAEANARHSEILTAMLHVAAYGFHLAGCVGGRIGHGASVLEGVLEMDDSLSWWWFSGKPTSAWYRRGPGMEP